NNSNNNNNNNNSQNPNNNTLIAEPAEGRTSIHAKNLTVQIHHSNSRTRHKKSDKVALKPEEETLAPSNEADKPNKKKFSKKPPKDFEKKMEEAEPVEMEADTGITLAPLYVEALIDLQAIVQRHGNEWDIAQHLNIGPCRINCTPAIIQLFYTLFDRYKSEFSLTVPENIQKLGVKKFVQTISDNISKKGVVLSSDLLSSTGMGPGYAPSMSGATQTDKVSQVRTNTGVNTSLPAASKVTGNERTSSVGSQSMGLGVTDVWMHTPVMKHVPREEENNANAQNRPPRANQRQSKSDQSIAEEAKEEIRVKFTTMLQMNHWCVVNAISPGTNSNTGNNATIYDKCDDFYFEKLEAGIHSSNLKDIQTELSAYMDVSHLIVGLEQGMDVRHLNSLKNYKMIEKLVNNRIRVVRLLSSNQLMQNRSNYVQLGIKSNNVISTSMCPFQINTHIQIYVCVIYKIVKGRVHPSIVPLMYSLKNIMTEYDRNDWRNEAKWYHYEQGPRVSHASDAGNSSQIPFITAGANVSMSDKNLNAPSGYNNTAGQSHLTWELEMNVECRMDESTRRNETKKRCGELVLTTKHVNGGAKSKGGMMTKVALPCVKLHSNVSNFEDGSQSDTFLEIRLDQFAIDMTIFEFIIAVQNNIALASLDVLPRAPSSPRRSNVAVQQKKAVSSSGHTLCVAIHNMNLLLSCAPFYDKLECSVAVKDQVSLCWSKVCLTAMRHQQETPYATMLTASIPKLETQMIVKQEKRLNVCQFSIDGQISQGFHLRSDGLPLTTVLLSVRNVSLDTSIVTLSTLKLLVDCIQHQTSKRKIYSESHHSDIRSEFSDEESPSVSKAPTAMMICISNPHNNTKIDAEFTKLYMYYYDEGRVSYQTPRVIRATIQTDLVVKSYDGGSRSSGWYPTGSSAAAAASASSGSGGTPASGSKRYPHKLRSHPHSTATGILTSIMQVSGNTNSEKVSAYRKKRHEPLQILLNLKDIKISFLHYQSYQLTESNFFPGPKKLAVNLIRICPQNMKLSLKTNQLRRILEVQTNKYVLEIEDSPDSQWNNQFVMKTSLGIGNISIHIASHTAPYSLMAFYHIHEFLTAQHSQVASYLGVGIKAATKTSRTRPSIVVEQAKPNPPQSLSESVFVCVYKIKHTYTCVYLFIVISTCNNNNNNNNNYE
ncbi:hypothetical protein RFI_10210, partial [Reticulomyxa filosa]